MTSDKITPMPQQPKPKNVINMPSPAAPTPGQSPYSQQAEEAVIGSMLIDPSVSETLMAFLQKDDFYFLRHAEIWEAVTRLIQRKDAVDNITVGKELEDMGKLDLIGGPSVITHLIANTPTSQHAEVYGRLVERAAIRRKLMQAADDIKALALDEQQNIDVVTEGAELALREASLRPGNADVPEHIETGLMSVFEATEQKYAMLGETDPYAIGGIPFGIRDMDKVTDGWRKARTYIIGGRLFNGKTSFLLSAALKAAMQGQKVLTFNTADGDRNTVIIHMLSMYLGIEKFRIEGGRFSKDEWKRYVDAVAMFSKLPLYIESEIGIRPLTVRNKIRSTMRIAGDIDMVICDYIQRMKPDVDPPGRTKDEKRLIQGNGYHALSYIADEFMDMAKVFNKPFLIGAQLNRAGAGSVTPEIEHIEGSDKIAQNADVVILLHRPGEKVDGQMTQAFVAKNRVTGRTGMVQTLTSKKTGAFYDYTDDPRLRGLIP